MVCCFVVCKNVKPPIAIVSVYRFPSTNVKAGLDELHLIIADLALYTNHLIIASDFNVDLLYLLPPVSVPLIPSCQVFI